jgi:predicted RNA-binding protein with RPS1 domain
MPKFSIGLLLYGQQVQLHQRCVESVSQLLLSDRLDLVCDVRIGLNNTHPAAVRFAVELSRKTGKRVLAYTPQWPSGSPAYKYPVLRKMLFDTADPVADWVLWFDDDSFVRPTPGWLERAAERTEEHDVLGYLRASEIARDRVEDARNVLKEGDKVTALIINVDRKTRGINLSVRAKDQVEQAEAMNKLASDSGSAASGTTNLGALLKAKLNEQK